MFATSLAEWLAEQPVKVATAPAVATETKSVPKAAESQAEPPAAAQLDAPAESMVRDMIGGMVAKPPSLVAMVYVPENPDGSRKNCSNCWKWVSDYARCLDVDGTVQAKQVCGLHVYGEPQLLQIRRGTKTDPERAGLVDAPDGSACNNCQHFLEAFKNSTSGYCMRASRDQGEMPTEKVHGLGCCAGWEPKK